MPVVSHISAPFAGYDATARLLCEPETFVRSTLHLTRAIAEDGHARPLHSDEPDREGMVWSVYCGERNDAGEILTMCLGDFRSEGEAKSFASRVIGVLSGSSIWMSEVACCIWEELMSLRETNNLVRLTFDNNGCGAMRLLACDWAFACDQAWSKVADDFDMSFDWDFVPRWIAENVEWAESGPLLNGVRITL